MMSYSTVRTSFSCVSAALQRETSSSRAHVLGQEATLCVLDICHVIIVLWLSGQFPVVEVRLITPLCTTILKDGAAPHATVLCITTWTIMLSIICTREDLEGKSPIYLE